MKRQLLIVSALIFGLFTARGTEGDTLRNTFYGIEINQFITGSGYSSATELLLSVTEGRRSFHVGFYFCTDAKRITGIIAHHEIALSNPGNENILRPFAFYNVNARITRLETTETTKGDISSSGIYKTFEHHLGIGLKIQISRDIYFSASAGYGIYFGSMKKPVIISGTNEVMGSNGFSPILKMGFGLIL